MPSSTSSSVRQPLSEFRSPCLTRRSIDKNTVTMHMAKKSRRAKSTEHSSTNTEPVIVEEENLNELPERNEESKFSSLIARNHDTMSKSELVGCYRLLMSEKLRLERFLSIISKNNEMARNRLESDLLDAMMCIEDLKQALEVRMTKDPQEAEERRYLIRQNKKLLNQLEEELKKKPIQECCSTQTETDEDGVASLNDRLTLVMSSLRDKEAELSAARAKQQRLEQVMRDLRSDNVDLRDQLAKINDEDDPENALAESDKHLVRGSAQANELPILDVLRQTIRVFYLLMDEVDRNNTAPPSNTSRDSLESIASPPSADHYLVQLASEMQSIIAAVLAPPTQSRRSVLTSTSPVGDESPSIDRDFLVEKFNVIGQKLQILSPVTNDITVSNSGSVGESSPDVPSETSGLQQHYWSQLQGLKRLDELELTKTQLNLADRRRGELHCRVNDLVDEVTGLRSELRLTEASLSAARKTEAALRRRLLAAMDQGMPSTPSDEAINSTELQVKLAKAEATNATLSDIIQLDRTRVLEQARRISQLELENRTCMDKILLLQTTETSAQRGIVRLQVLYEDMLREYSESRSQELSWRNERLKWASNRLRESPPTSIQVAELQQKLDELNGKYAALRDRSITCNNTDNPLSAISGPCNNPVCQHIRSLLKSVHLYCASSSNQSLDAAANDDLESLQSLIDKSSLGQEDIHQLQQLVKRLQQLNK